MRVHYLVVTITLALLMIGLSASTSMADSLPSPFNGFYNGDFEVATPPGEDFPWGWNEIGGEENRLCAQVHTGLNATGLEPGTQAALLVRGSVAGATREMIGQALDAGPQWELSFLTAMAAPTVKDRQLNLILFHGADPDPFVSGTKEALLRVDASGNLQAYDYIGGGGWTTLPGCAGVISFSIDADSDGKLESPSDTLNVHSIKIVGHYDDTPTYDVYISNANSENMILRGADIPYFFKTLPPAGEGPSSVIFYCASSDSYVVDQVCFSSVPEPSGLVLGLGMLLSVLWYKRIV